MIRLVSHLLLICLMGILSTSGSQDEMGSVFFYRVEEVNKLEKLEADLKENAADCPEPPSNTRRPARHDGNPIQDSLSARSRSEKAQ
jgi:hypothetical protein